jgi:hypothetical protein
MYWYRLQIKWDYKKRSEKKEKNFAVLRIRVQFSYRCTSGEALRDFLYLTLPGNAD